MLKRSLHALPAIAFCTLVWGCGPGGGESAPGGDKRAASAAAPGKHDHGHDHASEGPHGGRLIVLGDEEYHAELVHDEATHTVRVYLLDADAKEPARADQPEIGLQLLRQGEFVRYTLKAAQGASEFSLSDEALCDALAHSDEVRARLQVTIGAKPYTGTIEYEGHGHE